MVRDIRNRGARILEALLLLLILATAGGLLLQSIIDPDLFWHLKTGEWIWEHRALPGEYLFATGAQDTPPETQRFQMTAYWLAQIVFHLVHAAGGMGAIVAFRFALFALLLLPLFLRCRGADPLVFLGLLVFAVAALLPYPVERPQYFSFVFAGVLLWLLEGFRAAGNPGALRRRAAAVPLLLLVWAQCHGGYVVGLGLLGLVLLAESLKQLHPRLGPLPTDRWRALLLSGAAGFLASCVNPNGVHVFSVARVPDWQSAFITEYRSTIQAFRVSHDPAVLAYWLLLALVTAGLLLAWRRVDATAVLLTAVAAYPSFTHIRFIPFFLVVALPVAVRAFSAPRLLRTARAAIVAAGLCAGALFLRGALPRYAEIPESGVVSPRAFPTEAADFVLREGLRGNVYNFYDWGGYLLWRLSPAKVFIDGRNASQSRYEVYRMIHAGQPGPWGPIWKAAFESNGVRYAVVDYFNPFSGEFRGLVDDLLADPAWVPVFASPTSVVFAEDTAENRAVVRRNALAKPEFYAILQGYCADIAAVSPGYVQARVAQGEILTRMGDRAAALRAYLAALEIAPDHRLARKRVDGLTAGGG